MALSARDRADRSELDHRRDGACDRTPGTQVYAGTLNLTRPLQIEVTAADSATLLAEISRLMLAAEQGKARYRRLADRAAQIYAPAVHGSWDWRPSSAGCCSGGIVGPRL